MTLDITTLPAYRLAALRHTGAYSKIGPAFRELGAIAGRAGLFAHPDAIMIGVYYDDPRTTPPEMLRSAAGVSIAPDAAVPDGLEEVCVPAGPFAIAKHVGPYEDLPKAWTEISQTLMPSSGEKRRPAACYEIYRNDPTNTAPADLITEICIPIE
jgi:AraC family transcriptional regulator